MMHDIEKVIENLERMLSNYDMLDDIVINKNNEMLMFHRAVAKAALDLLKEQEAMNVDVFVQWCIDSHIMGDATVRGIKYWVGKYKEIKEGR